MAVPLLHFVFDCACDVAPVKIDASVAGDAAEVCRSVQRRAGDCSEYAGPVGFEIAFLGSNGVGVAYAVFEAAYHGA